MREAMVVPNPLGGKSTSNKRKGAQYTSGDSSPVVRTCCAATLFLAQM